MFKGISNLGSMLKQAQQVGSRLQGLNEELKTRRVTGSAGGGLVNVEASGVGEILACRIDLSLAADRELLEDLLPAAINQALAKAKEMHSAAIQSMTQGLELPGLNDLLAKAQDEQTEEE